MRTPGTAQLSAATDFTLRAVAPAAIISHRAVDLPANDVIYDWHAKLLYASIPSTNGGHAKSIVALDPETGQVAKSVVVGSEPTRLAISDNGEFLYVSLEGASSVRRVNLATCICKLVKMGTDRNGMKIAERNGNDTFRGEQPFGLDGDPRESLSEFAEE